MSNFSIPRKLKDTSSAQHRIKSNVSLSLDGHQLDCGEQANKVRWDAKNLCLRWFENPLQRFKPNRQKCLIFLKFPAKPNSQPKLAKWLWMRSFRVARLYRHLRKHSKSRLWFVLKPGIDCVVSLAPLGCVSILHDPIEAQSDSRFSVVLIRA